MEGGGRGEKMEGGGGEEKENEKKKKSDVECHVMLWRFGCGDLGVSVAALSIYN
jgi:hypothetical protein